MNKTILKKYARLVVRMGVNIKKGQGALIMAETDQAEFALMVAEEAYKAGAKWVAPFYAPMELFSEGEVNGKAVFEALVKYREVSGCEGQIMACAPRNFDEVSWMFTTGVTATTLDPCDFENPFTSKGFSFINSDVQKSWDGRFGAGARIHELLK